jgi:hypothetical protein
MKNMLLNQDRTLKPIVVNLMAVASLSLMVIPWLLDLNRKVSYFLFCAGAVIGAIAAYSDRFGSKTFTTDPLGWREAKKSYETKKDADKSPKKGDPS